jgi:hypothetical protein
MSDTKSFKLTKADLYIGGGGEEDKLDIKAVISEFQWFESIDSPFIRLDIAILDSTDLDTRLYGTEKLKIEFSTFAGQEDGKKEGRCKAEFKMYKIGSVIKKERAKMYILHFAPEAMYYNEANRAFGMFGVKNGKQDVVQRMLRQHLKIPNREIFIEGHTFLNVISPNWRPVDCIAYMSDKVSRLSKGKGSKKSGNVKKNGTAARQAGFLFWQNKHGYNFASIDMLCEQQPMHEYTYGQKNVNDNDPVADMYRIESVKYPDRANQLEKLRNGVYKTSTFGIVMAAPTMSTLPGSTASTGDSGPEGTVMGPVVTQLLSLFDKASTLEKGFPYDLEAIEEFLEMHPTRTRLKILPKMVQQDSTNIDGGAEEESESILNAASYATQRWMLLNTHTLTIQVPGNTRLFAGAVVKVNMPASQQKNKNKLPKDRMFSGKYLVKGLKHVYTNTGITTEVYLCRDSLPATNK